MEKTISNICGTCHQQILPEYYFCPNCGTNLKPVPLPVDVSAQVKIYAFSIVLPMIAFIFVTKWEGVKYLKSNDPKEKQIGQIACLILALSTIFCIWYAVVWTQNFIKSQLDSINTDLSSYGL